MENSKPPASQNFQDLRDEQRALEWLDDMGIGFTRPALPKRKPSLADTSDSDQNAA